MRVMQPGSSEKDASILQRETISFARAFAFIKSGHEVSSLPAEARLDVAVRLIDGHKNFVGIVLAEA